MYSVSKACLNASTKLLQIELDSTTNSLENKQKNKRVLAICPGNFESQMSTTDEKASSVCVDEAARTVIDLCTRPWSTVAPGHLYRNGQMIAF